MTRAGCVPILGAWRSAKSATSRIGRWPTGDTARANQRRRVADRQRAEAATAEREREEREHMERGLHGWKNWQYSADYKTETRECRECGLTETRPVRL